MVIELKESFCPYCDLNMLLFSAFSLLLHCLEESIQCLGITRPKCCHAVPVFTHETFSKFVTYWEMFFFSRTRRRAVRHYIKNGNGFLNTSYAYFEQNSSYMLLEMC